MLIGTDGGAYQTLGHDAHVDLVSRTCRSGSSITSASTYEYAVQRLRRHAGQLRLVRSERGAHARRHHERSLADGAGRRRLRRDHRPARLRASSTPSRRTATRRGSNRVTGESKSIRADGAGTRRTAQRRAASRTASTGTRRCCSRRPIRACSTSRGNNVFRSTDRGDSWTAISPDLTTQREPRRRRHMGVKGSDVRISKNDGIVAWPTIVVVRRIGEAARPLLRRHRRRRRERVEGRAARRGTRRWRIGMPGFVKGAWVSKVMPSRYDAGTVYVASDAHRLNDYETHIWVSNDFGATFQSLNGNLKGEARQDADRRSEQPGRALRGHGDRASSCRSIAARAGRGCKATSRTCAWTRSRCIRATTRCSSRRTAARIWILDHISPIQEYTAAQGAATRSCSRSIRRCSGSRATTRTTSSGAISSSSARTRRRDAVIQYVPEEARRTT